jgi:hypothetical protein
MGAGLPDQFAQRGVARSAQVDPGRSQSDHDRVRVQVPAGAGAGEQPRTASRVCSAHIWARGQVSAQQGGEGLGHGSCGVGAELDEDLRRGDLDSIGAQPRNPYQRLGVQEQQRSGHAVCEGVLGAGQAAGQQVQPLFVGDQWHGPGGAVAKVQLCVQLAGSGPDDEGTDEGAGGRPFGDPLIEVCLRAFGDGRPAPREPDQEPAGLGDLLLGSADRPAQVPGAPAYVPHAAQVMPGGELLEGMPYGGVADAGEALSEPGLEPGQVGVAGREQSVVDQQRADVLSRQAGRCGVDAVMAESDASLA